MSEEGTNPIDHARSVLDAGDAAIAAYLLDVPVEMVERVSGETPPEKVVERYEHIYIIVKERPDGQPWFDILFDIIAADCQGSETEPCTCGMESMGGSSGTLEQCYDSSTAVGLGLQPIDLARAIVALEAGQDYINPDILKAVDWAHKEIDFENSFGNEEDEEDEEDE